MYDFIIVGAGIFGATFARRVTDSGKRCLVVDKRPHIAGAAHDSPFGDYFVSSYGAHIFHTHSEEVWNFARQFCDFVPFVNRPKAVSGGRVYSFPVNLMTLHQLWGVTTPAEASARLAEVVVPCENPSNFEEWALSMVGEEIYRKFFYGYTKKQYMREPRELPSSIIQRLPIRMTYDENYFTTNFQGMPSGGYTGMVRSMLDGIDVELGINYLRHRDRLDRLARRVVYTGPVDEFFDYQYGKLDYNTLRFERREFSGDQQGNAVLNHVDESVPHLRSVEHRHFYVRGESQKHYGESREHRSVVTYDVPARLDENPEPFYPVRDRVNSELYQRYAAIKPSKVVFGGRLGEYKYLDMDQSMASALQKSRSFAI